MPPILQSFLPFAPWADPRTRRLPGVLPVEPGDWLRVDDAYRGQMAERDRLLFAHPGEVMALEPGAVVAAVELLLQVLPELSPLGFVVGDADVRRPDGVTVPIDLAAPLLTLGRLCQEDFCILQKRGDVHVLTGAVLCFPASWTLSEKFQRPLIGVHQGVAAYDAELAPRVQRLFDAIRVGQPLWRWNALLYASDLLHHPRSERTPRSKPIGRAPFVRSERQCLVRLPETQAVVFSIHTYLVRFEDLSPQQVCALDAFPLHRGGG